jgi:hypothetical protein
MPPKTYPPADPSWPKEYTYRYPYDRPYPPAWKTPQPMVMTPGLRIFKFLIWDMWRYLLGLIIIVGILSAILGW